MSDVIIVEKISIEKENFNKLKLVYLNLAIILLKQSSKSDEIEICNKTK